MKTENDKSMKRIFLAIAAGAAPFVFLTAQADAASLEPDIAAKHTILLSDQWGGGHRIKFDFNGHTAWLIEPETPAPDRVWFWTMQWVDAFVEETGRDKLVQRGLYHVHLEVHELRANAEGLVELAKFHDYLVNELGFARKTRLVGMSWGGFYSIRYTAAYPDRVDRIYLDAPLMNVYTRPEADLGPWLETKPTAGGGINDPEQPINLAQPVADAKVPIFLVYGGVDVAVVPKDNCEVFIPRFQEAGGTFVAIDLDPNRDHHPHGPSAAYFDKLLDFMTADFRSARVRIDGDIVPGTNFTCAAVNVSAQVLDYGYSSPTATVEVALEPLGGGDRLVSAFEIDGDAEEHAFAASFAGLAPGRRYRVTARVLLDGAALSTVGDAAVTAREFAWFEESAATFPNAGWTYDATSVAVSDDMIAGPTTESQTVSFAPPAEEAVGRNRIVLQLKLVAATDMDRLGPLDGRAGVTGVLDANDVPHLAVWGEGSWHMTDLVLANGEERTVEIALDRPEGTVGYRLRERDGGWAEAGRYSLADASPVSSVSVEGLIGIRQMRGMRYDANLVADEQGVEYADYAAAKAAGAEDPLHPLWLSAWNLAGVYGSMTYRDPNGLVSFTGASRVLRSEPAGADGAVRCWYGPATDEEIAAGAGKYVRRTVELGLDRAITDASDVRLSDCSVAGGELSFRVGIDGAPITREAVTSLVEARGDLDQGSWQKPAAVRFADGKVVVTPETGTARCFSRVKIEAE